MKLSIVDLVYIFLVNNRTFFLFCHPAVPVIITLQSLANNKAISVIVHSVKILF